MPNWCDNILTVTGPSAAVERFCAAVAADESGPVTDHDGAGNTLRLEKIAPLPEGQDWLDWQLAHWGTKWDVEPSGHLITDFAVAGDTNLLAATWWFDSAWSPPVEAMRTASQQHPDVAVHHVWAEEGNGCSGYLQFRAGNVTELTAGLNEHGCLPELVLCRTAAGWLQLASRDWDRPVVLHTEMDVAATVRRTLRDSLDDRPAPWLLLAGDTHDGGPLPLPTFRLGPDLSVDARDDRYAAAVEIGDRDRLSETIQRRLTAGWIETGYWVHSWLPAAILAHAEHLIDLDATETLTALLMAHYEEQSTDDISAVVARLAAGGHEAATLARIACGLAGSGDLPAAPEDLVPVVHGILADPGH